MGRLGRGLLGPARVRRLDVPADLRGPRLSLRNRARRGLFAHSGGSSPKTRFQITVASLVVITEASAPMPATRPAHIKRLTSSLSVIVGRSLRTDPGGLRVEPVTDRLDDEALGALVALVVGIQEAEDPPGQHLLDRAVEGHGGELGGDVAAECALGLRAGDDLRD